MMDFCKGMIVQINEQEIVLDMGMVGIVMQVPLGNAFIQGNQAILFCHFHWNTENGPSLFGFSTTLDRTVFRIVISCSGIGPKIALAILADLGAQVFLHAISTGDDQVLSKVSGIGKKKAEQIVVHLKHKVATLLESGVVVDDSTDVSHFHDVSQALQSLNYSRQEVGRAMDYLKKNTKMKECTFDYLLRQALSYLSKQL